MEHTGWKRVCLRCKKEHFPRTYPVVMMLVTHGESIEDAARRELYEEAGVIGLEAESKE